MQRKLIQNYTESIRSVFGEIKRFNSFFFQVILDKGTLDAILLSGDRRQRLNNYRRSIMEFFELQEEQTDYSPRYFVIFSCNFTKDELRDMFEGDDLKFDIVS